MTVRLGPNQFRLYDRDTPAGHDIYPAVPQERIRREQTGPWKRRVVVGPTSADAEELIDSWTQDDYSGGFGIEDGNESTDTARIRFSMGLDTSHPKHLALNRQVTTPANPSWASDPFWPLGDIGTQFYGAWEEGIAGWDVANDAWYSTQNAWPSNFVPVAKAVPFCGLLFVPGGAQGFVALTETTAATGTLNSGTITANTDIDALAFGLHDGCLWAIDVRNELWQLTPTGAAAGATTTANWGETGATGDSMRRFGLDFVLDTTATPTALVNWFNAAQEEALWCITRKRGAYILSRDVPDWVQYPINPGAHPGWGSCAAVFRDGEDMWIAGGGLDVTRLTVAQVEVPLSGPNKDQGLPPNYANGEIVDLCAERAKLYALIKGGSPNTFANWVEDPDGGEAPYFAGVPVPMWVAAWTGTAWEGVWQDTEADGDPTWMVVSCVDDDPAVWWGGEDGIARKMPLPLPFLNPAANVELGVYPFTDYGWAETFRYDGNMSGWDKIASHAFAMMDYATDDAYVDVSYRTDDGQYQTNLMEPPYTLWKRVNRAGRTIMRFDDVEIDPNSGLPWRAGEPFQWMQFLYEFYANDSAVSPIWMWHSLHHLTVPQDSASFIIKVPLSFERDWSGRNPDEMWETLLAFKTSRRLCWLQLHNPRDGASGEAERQVFFRGRVTQCTAETYAGADNNTAEVAVVNFVEIGASDNARTHEAVSLEVA